MYCFSTNFTYVFYYSTIQHWVSFRQCIVNFICNQFSQVSEIWMVNFQFYVVPWWYYDKILGKTIGLLLNSAYSAYWHETYDGNTRFYVMLYNVWHRKENALLLSLYWWKTDDYCWYLVHFWRSYNFTTNPSLAFVVNNKSMTLLKFWFILSYWDNGDFHSYLTHNSKFVILNL